MVSKLDDRPPDFMALGSQYLLDVGIPAIKIADWALMPIEKQAVSVTAMGLNARLFEEFRSQGDNGIEALYKCAVLTERSR